MSFSTDYTTPQTYNYKSQIPRMINSKILIVGAGAAGISAASRLMENNISSFKILEAGNRIGGRILTSNLGEATVEIGAQWVHGKVNNIVHKLGTDANQISGNSYDVRKSKCIMSCGSFLDDNLVHQLLSLFEDILHDEDNLLKFNGSLGDYFTENLKKKLKDRNMNIDSSVLKSFIDWFHRFQNSIDGSDSWFETSACGTVEYHECEGNPLTRWKDGGYSNIFELIMGKNKQLIKERIMFNKAVKSVYWDQKPVNLICTDGSSFTADHVILTVSLGVLKENYDSLFVPALPFKKVQAIKDLGFGTVNKIFLQFPFRWWPLDCPGFNLLCANNAANYPQEGLSWVNEVFGFYSVDGNPRVLCGWLVGASARDMELSTDLQVLQCCHQLLVNFLGQHFKIPFPDGILRSEWNKNIHFCGSYSFRTVKSEDSKVKAVDLASPLYLSPAHPALLFAGEATHNHFYSTVHGAIETGWREAERLKAYFEETPTKRIYGNIPRKINYSNVCVVIIGAGMAGLGAAKTLMGAGISKFVILEAQDYVGGRVCSVKMDEPNNSTCIELGAQWIHGENNPLFELAEGEGLLSSVISVEGEGLFLMPNGEEIPFAIVQEVAQVVEDILECCCQFVNEPEDNNPGSIGEFLLEKFSQYLDTCSDSTHVRKIKKDIFDWHKRFQVIDNSCDELNCLSAKSWGLYQYSGGINYNNFKAGYSSLIECMAKDFPKDSIKTSTEVKHISMLCNEPEVQVICEDGSIYSAEHVIVTCSLGYLKENHHTLFNPLLPVDMIKAINSMGFDTINKLFLVYNYNWWPQNIKGIQLVWDCEEHEDSDHQSWLRHISGFDVLENTTGVLLGWIGGEGARIMETLTDTEVCNDCTKVIRRFFNTPHIPPPIKIFRSSWHSNMFVRGGYSHITKDCDEESCGSDNLSKPIYAKIPGSHKQHPAVLLAGEAVHKHYFSTTHGAYISGKTQAQTIIDFRKNNCYQ